MTKITYVLDIKVYARANMYELPFRLPEQMIDERSILIPGYHSVAILFTQAEFEEFMDWCFLHGDILKVIGSEKAATVCLKN